MYIHSLTATCNDTLGVERTGMTRAVNRRKWDQGELENLMANHESETGRVFAAYKRLLQIRKQQPAFHPDAAQRLLELGDALFGLERGDNQQGQRILALFNCTSSLQSVCRDQLPPDIETWEELIGEADIVLNEEQLVLPPYTACWFSDGH